MTKKIGRILSLPARRHGLGLPLESLSLPAPKGARTWTRSTQSRINAVRHRHCEGPRWETSCLLAGGPPKQRNIFVRTWVVLLVRQQSKREREKRSVLVILNIVLIDQAPSPNQPQYRSQPQSQIRNTPGVKLKETRLDT